MTRESQPWGWLRSAESWLDDKGKGAWIASMVLAFIFVWPLGLALLAYMIWGKKMFSCSRSSSRADRCASRSETYRAMRTATRPSGNSAFDAYKAETLKRLEEEQQQFESFLERLRAAKDKAEFDEFMEDRAKRAAAVDVDSDEDKKEEA
ncbi:DUF2852 domain-containing protein [Celeribacter sp. ASW11-22]|nr:DUF2852 domain-containing protein [Celeribacter litoreus]MCA0043594.1 DUF2852 domain-containing protein [Celeribacter litoreus]